MSDIATDAPGATRLLMGNEAVARGALEAGVGFAVGYPGNPSTEVLASLIETAHETGIYAEWSANEIVALEMAAAASWAGIRAVVSMKNNGVNVASDFLVGLSLSGINKGLVLVVCDDPDALSNNEEDTRFLARHLDIPLLEPSSPQEAKDMTRWAFDLAEDTGTVCLLRMVNRISHSRSNVRLEELPRREYRARFDDLTKGSMGRYINIPTVAKHKELHQKIARAQELFEHSPFNRYTGPEEAELLVITCGTGVPYSGEAVRELKLEGRVGILKLGTTHPLPERLIRKYLGQSQKVLVAEEVDPFLEAGIAELICALPPESPRPALYGKRSGHINVCGGLNPEVVTRAVAGLLGVSYQSRPPEYTQEAEVAQGLLINRGFAFCPGCPHRASFWALKEALNLDGRDGFALGDVGCYAIGLGASGYYQTRTLQCMGCGIGTANGFAKLGQFGFNQPVIAVCGDATFFHAALPALLNAIHSRASFTFVILDNSATAMTGFQPHPGIGRTGTGESTSAVSIEALCQSLGLPVEICDPFELKKASALLTEAMSRNEERPRVVILRRKCALLPEVRNKPSYKVQVDPEKCLGEACGCNRYCTRVFHCPGLVWDGERGRAVIDEVLCTGCGLCAEMCSQHGIVREAVSHEGIS
ncbi:MAG: thiamine pyrophosphate-dependent enzyme [Chloroflexota bacterium]